MSHSQVEVSSTWILRPHHVVGHALATLVRLHGRLPEDPSRQRTVEVPMAILDAPMMCFGRRFYKASRMMSFAKNDAYDLRNCCVKLRNDAYCSSNSVVSTSNVVDQEMIPSVENGVQSASLECLRWFLLTGLGQDGFPGFITSTFKEFDLFCHCRWALKLIRRSSEFPWQAI